MKKQELDFDLRKRDDFNRKATAWILTIFSSTMLFVGIHLLNEIKAGNEFYKTILGVIIFLYTLGIAFIKYFLNDLEDRRKKFAEFLKDLNEIYRLHNGISKDLNKDDIKRHLDIVMQIDRLASLSRAGYYWDNHFAIKMDNIKIIYNQSNSIIDEFRKNDPSVISPDTLQTSCLFTELSEKYYKKINL